MELARLTEEQVYARVATAQMMALTTLAGSADPVTELDAMIIGAFPNDPAAAAALVQYAPYIASVCGLDMNADPLSSTVMEERPEWFRRTLLVLRKMVNVSN